MKARLLPIFLALVVQAGAVYVPPDDTKALFRRDALPMDADLMRELSGQLTVLARRAPGEDPAQQRATAQLLAMASGLHPANRRSRDISRQLAAGDVIKPADAPAFAAAKARAWDIAAWLLSEEAGPEGRLLGQQLLDALHILDPGHPGAKAYEAAGELQRWKGVVAPLNRFRNRIEPPAPEPPEPPEPTPPEPSPPPAPKPPAPPIRLAEGSVMTPFEVVLGQSRVVALVPLSLQVTADPATEELGLHILPVPRNESALQALLEARTHMFAALTRQWGRLPEHQLATIQSNENAGYTSRNGTAWSGPASLLLSSAISGKPLRQDVIFIGDVAADGGIHPPDLAWDYLRKLRSGKGGRLIVPTRFEVQIRALLAMEEPDFFIRYEVIAADTLEQALTLAATDPGSASLAEADQDFARFRELTAPTNIGPLAVNKHVRERLGRILAANPGHLSAKMILLQGSGQRPTRLDRATFVLELQSCLEPMAWIFGSGVETRELKAADLETAFDTCRKRLDPLEQYVSRSERQLHAEARDIVDALRSLAQISKRNDGTVENPLAEPHAELRVRYEALLQSFQPPRPAPPDQERKN